MKTVSAAFLTMLQTSEFLVEADLYTITLQNGTVLRYTSAQLPITYNGSIYDAAAAIQSVTATAQPFFTGDGNTTSAHLVGPNGESITSAATVTAMHQTDWQGRQRLYSAPRTNLLTDSGQTLPWTAGGTSPPACNNITYAGTPCVETYYQPGAQGYAVGHSSSSGSFNFVINTPYSAFIWIALGRALTGNESATVFLTGTAGVAFIVLNASNCAPFVGKFACASRNNFQLTPVSGTGGTDRIYTYTTNLAAPLSVYVAQAQVEQAATTGVYIPTTTTPVTVTDYAVDSSGNVTLGQSPAVDATLDWDGTGSTGNYAPGFVRGSTKCAVGLESDDLEVDILFDTTTLLSGQNPAAFVAAGGLDNAVLKLDKALAPDWSNPVVNGVVNLFTGYIGETKCEQGKITLTVNSRVKILNTSFPRNYFLPQDNNALFSAASGLNQASYAVNGTVAAGSSRTAFTTNCTQADGWFALGSVVWKTGANKGLTSFVKAYSHASGAFTLVYPLAAQPAAGDTFTAYPGYDRTQATCQTKFNNLAHFRGFPYVPTPETLELGQAGSPPQSIGGGGGAGVGGIGRGPGGQRGRIEQF